LNEEEKHYCLPPDTLKALIPTTTTYGVEIHNLVHSSHILKLVNWKPFLAVARFHLAKKKFLQYFLKLASRTDLTFQVQDVNTTGTPQEFIRRGEAGREKLHTTL
jgi:hypothetical protein